VRSRDGAAYRKTQAYACDHALAIATLKFVE
jgi:hypothetical protein